MANMYALQAGSDRLRDRVVAEVRAWRGRLGLTQGDLGRILGISQAQISARMRGQMEFSLTEIESLARAFGIEPTELMPPASRAPKRAGENVVDIAQSRGARYQDPPGRPGPGAVVMAFRPIRIAVGES